MLGDPQERGSCWNSATKLMEGWDIFSQGGNLAIRNQSSSGPPQLCSFCTSLFFVVEFPFGGVSQGGGIIEWPFENNLWQDAWLWVSQARPHFPVGHGAICQHHRLWAQFSIGMENAGQSYRLCIWEGNMLPRAHHPSVALHIKLVRIFFFSGKNCGWNRWVFCFVLAFSNIFHWKSWHFCWNKHKLKTFWFSATDIFEL